MADANRYEVRLGDRIAEIEITGTPDPKDLEAALAEVLSHKGFRLGMSLLFVDRTTGFNPDRPRIEAAVAMIAGSTRQMDNHIAVVVESESHYGIARGFAECAESHDLILMPFREIETARNWLIAQQSDSRYFPIPPTPGPG